MALDKKLKAFSRIDGNGRIVPGSTVLRKQKPKVGTWEENKTYQCCNTTTLYYTVDDTTISNLDFYIYCGDTPVYQYYSGSDTTSTSDIIDVLNTLLTEFPAIGTFAVVTDNITSAVFSLTMSTDLASIFCPYSNGLSFSIFAD